LPHWTGYSAARTAKRPLSRDFGKALVLSSGFFQSRRVVPPGRHGRRSSRSLAPLDRVFGRQERQSAPCQGTLERPWFSHVKCYQRCIVLSNDNVTGGTMPADDKMTLDERRSTCAKCKNVMKSRSPGSRAIAGRNGARDRTAPQELDSADGRPPGAPAAPAAARTDVWPLGGRERCRSSLKVWTTRVPSG